MSRTIIICLIAIGLIYSTVYSELKSKGPFSGKVSTINVTSSGAILAVSKSSLYRSTGDSSWQIVQFDNKGYVPCCFVNLPSGVIFAGTKIGLYQSDDDGISWKKISNTSVLGPVCSLLSLNTKELYVGTEKGELYHTSDQGKHWFSITLPIKNEPLVTLATDSKWIIYAGTRNGHILFSENGGIHWLTKSIPDKKNQLTSLVITKRGHLIASSNGGGVVRWNDQLKEYESISKDFPIQIVNGLFTLKNGSIIALTDYTGLQSSNDEGEHWLPLGLLKHSPSAIVCDNLDRILVGTDKGMYRLSTNSIWEYIGVPSTSISAFSNINDSTLLAGTKEAGIFTSTDQGNTWSQTSTGLSGLGVTCISKITDNIIAVGIKPEPPRPFVGGLHISFDTGRTWSQTRVFNKLVTSITSMSNHIFAGTDSGLFQSDDLGNIWVKTTSILKTKYISALTVSHDGYLLASTVSDLYGSADTGKTWMSMPSNPHMRVHQFISSDKSIFAVSRKQLFSSDDKGYHWKKLTIPTTNADIKHVEIDQNRNLYYCTTSQAYRSNEGGDVWSAMPIKFERIIPTTFIIQDNSSIIIGTEHLGVIVP